MRGFCGIGVYNYKHEINMGSLLRTAFCLDNVDYTFTVGRKYKVQSSDTVCATRYIPHFNYVDTEDFLEHIPRLGRIVSIEITEGAHNLKNFVHPEQAIYVLGNEVTGVPRRLLDKSIVVKIPSINCLNVANAGSIVLWDRLVKGK